VEVELRQRPVAGVSLARQIEDQAARQLKADYVPHMFAYLRPAPAP
jgi:hypothetical protein